MSQALDKRCAGDTRTISLFCLGILWEQCSKLCVRYGPQIFFRTNGHFMELTIIVQHQIGFAAFLLPRIVSPSDIGQHRLYSGIRAHFHSDTERHLACVAARKFQLLAQPLQPGRSLILKAES